jgi:UDP-N-acetylglucosamine--N-acetylmuramyl-(pentapeptide) pyrophosphoryl-undecaprenol N-acetylglucosamine transferase
MKILFSGGGTLGPVTPLLAIVETLRARKNAADFEFAWIGTERGVELPYIRRAGITLYTIPSGKLRRYFSTKNFTDIIQLAKGFFQARAILREFGPDVVVTAGGFVSVPVHFAAWTLGIPSVVHQQDVIVGLANRLMAIVAAKITVSTEGHTKKFSAKKAVYTGNPVRPSVLDGSREKGIELFKLGGDRATVFIFGGGTGAENINHTVEQLVKDCAGMFQIVHLTGSNRIQPQVANNFYHPYPFFIGEMSHAYAAADVIVSRAGFNAISEIAAWGKPAILIPIHGSHQEANAQFVVDAGGAVMLDESTLGAADLYEKIRVLLTDEQMYKQQSDALLGLFPKDAVEKVADLICAVGDTKAK